MSKKSADFIFCLAPLLMLCLGAYWIQTHTYLHKDLAIILDTAEKMLQGETYGHDIFEPNPPLIFYLNMLPIAITKLTGIKIIYTLRFYLISLIFISSVSSFYLFKKIFQPSTRMARIMFYALSFIFLLLPSGAFGQREHLMVVFSTPYILLAVCRLSNLSVPQYFAFLMGLMAGIGFSIKPFFLPIYCLIELFFIYKERNFWGWVRIESITALSFILLYNISVLLFCPVYLHMILPLWMPYYSGIIKPWKIVLTYPYFVLCCITPFLFFIAHTKTKYTLLHSLLMVTLIGDLISFLIPRVTWYYHIYPAVAIASLYFVLILAELYDSRFRQGFKFLLVGWLGSTLLCILVFNNMILTKELITYFNSDSAFKRMLNYLKQKEPNQSYDFFSMTHQLIVLEFYSTAHYVGSFSFFNWEYYRLSPQLNTQYKDHVLPFIKNTISTDLNNKKPHYVIVDNPSSLLYLKQPIDFPREYVKHTNFHYAWSQYTHETSIGPYDIYKRNAYNI